MSSGLHCRLQHVLGRMEINLEFYCHMRRNIIIDVIIDRKQIGFQESIGVIA